MAEPLIEVVWICRGCGCLMQDPHRPGCRFGPKPVECAHEGCEAKPWRSGFCREHQPPVPDDAVEQWA